MRFSICCDVESKTHIQKEFSHIIGEYEYVFIPNDDGIFHKLKIIVKVKEPEKFASSFIPSNEPGFAGTINMGGDKVVYDDLIDRAQTIESSMGVRLGVKRIHWNNPHQEVICETKEEEKLIQVTEVSWRQEYDDPIMRVTPEHIKNILNNLDAYSPLKFVMGFWREGTLDYKSLRYINAFFNFYFVIEGMFGNGKTKNEAVKKEFLKSKEYIEISKIMLETIKETKEHASEFEKWLSIHKQPFDEVGITEFLVNTRGDLHHFNPRRKKGTPFNHQEYHLAAWVAMGFAIHALLRVEVAINSQIRSPSG